MLTFPIFPSRFSVVPLKPVDRLTYDSRLADFRLQTQLGHSGWRQLEAPLEPVSRLANHLFSIRHDSANQDVVAIAEKDRVMIFE